MFQTIVEEIEIRFYLALTESRLAVQDVEVVVHAGGQQEVLMSWMPLQPPHAATHRTVAERPAHVAAVPQQHVLIVAASRDSGQQVQRMSDCGY